MDKNEVEKILVQYNSIIKECDGLYREIAKIYGLSDSVFWILYALREEKQEMTQSELCNTIYQPKQTVNSALKKMERDGYLELTARGDRRSKQICLTQTGIQLAEATVDYVISAEHRALSGLTEKERNTFITLFQKYTDLLRDSINRIERR